MKTKFYVFFIVWMIVGIGGVHAQDLCNNIYVGFSPLGSSRVSFGESDKDTNLRFDYKSCWNVNLSKEGMMKGFGYLTELTYGMGKFDKIKIEDNYSNDLAAMASQADDIWTVSGAIYGGQVFNQGKRVQFPLYAGVGVDYINGGIIHNIMPFVGVKLRIKVYFTNSIGMWVGGNYNIDFVGAKSFNDNNYSMKASRPFLDAGVVFSIN